MGLIYKKLALRGDVGHREVNALSDTGASRCLVSERVAREVATPRKTPQVLRFEMARRTLETNQAMFGTVTFEGHDLLWMFIVLPDLSEELILGADFFQVWKIKLDPEIEEVSMDPSALRLKLV